jgi:predicted secreted hydrolase
MDREWSTSILGDEQQGWDWFSLQLEDGRDLMFFQLRNRDPGEPPFTDGLVVAEDGTTRRLGAEDVALTVLDTWESPKSGVRYPVRWRMVIPSEGLDLFVTPYLLDQELDVSVRYWEGAVRLTAAEGEAGVSGEGYLEMTGYGEAGGPR